MLTKIKLHEVHGEMPCIIMCREKQEFSWRRKHWGRLIAEVEPDGSTLNLQTLYCCS